MHNKLSNFSPKIERGRYLVMSILLSELPDCHPDPQAFIERELDRMTAGGAEVVSILPAHDDLLVILKAPDPGGVA